MAIKVACQCGKTFTAKSEHAGKRAKCPACGRVLAIPGISLPAYDVFVSHSHADKPTAEAICAVLEAQRIRCWIAPRDITPGKDWGAAIIDGINQCRAMILVFSAASNGSAQVSREVERAVAKGLFLIPFRLEDVPMSTTMEYFLSSPHWLDAMTPPLESHLEALARTVKSLLGQSQGSAASTPVHAAPHLPTGEPLAGIRQQIPVFANEDLNWIGQESPAHIRRQVARRRSPTASRNLMIAAGIAMATVVLGLFIIFNRGTRDPAPGSNPALAASNNPATTAVQKETGQTSDSAPARIRPGPSAGPMADKRAVPQSPASNLVGNLPETSFDLGRGVKLEMVQIPAGEFMMGSPDPGNLNAKPQHRVRITKPFYLGKYLVTQEQWDEVIGDGPNYSKCPVGNLSWDGCQKFLDKLNAMSNPGLGKFQLPTEAQWEYACRAGSTTRHYFGQDGSELDEYAWFNGNSDGGVHPVGQKKPNAWGLYDMHGNVFEHCQDWYDEGYYAVSPTDDPTGPATGRERVRRGGCAYNTETTCESAFRACGRPQLRGFDVGLRVARVTAEK